MASFFKGALLVWLVGVVACGGPSPTAKQGTSVSNLGGQALFDGFFFGQGSAAALFPEIWGEGGLQQVQKDRLAHMSGDDLATEIEQVQQQYSDLTIDERSRLSELANEYRAGIVRPSTAAVPDDISSRIHSILLKKITVADPTFFERFGVALRSGDELKVSAAIAEGNKQIRNVIQVLGSANSSPRPDLEIDTFMDIESVSEAVFNLVVAAEIVVFVAIAAVLVIPDRAPVPGTSHSTSDLQYATLLASITTRLDPPITNGR